MVSNPFGGSPLTVQIDSDTSGLTSGIDQAIGKLNSLEGAVGAAGAALAGLSAGGIAKSISAASDLNASLTESQAIMGDLSQGEMKAMEEAARDVGKTTTFSADEAGSALYYLASAGFDAQESTEALGDVSQFAQAGMFDLETAVDLSTDALTSLGMASEDPQENLENLNRVQDTFVRANELANASVEQYAQAMTNKLGPAMRAAGMEVEEGTSALAVFADAGLKGRRAGTILTRTIEGLQDNARENADAFQELGISVFDANGEMRPMQDIIRDMEDAMGGMSTEQRAATMEQLGFNQRARQGIEILMGNSDALGEYQSELENAGGATERVAEKQLQSFQAQLDLLKSQFQDIAIEIGTVFLPVLERLVSAFSVVVEWFAEINSRTDGMVGAITLLTGLFSGLAMMGWSVVSMLGGLGPALTLVKGIAVGLALPFIKIVAVIGTLITIGAALHQAWTSNFAGIREQTMRVVGAIRGQFLRVMEVAQAVIGPILSDILGAFTGFGDGAESSLSRVISAVADILVAGIQWAGDAIVRTLLWLRNWWQQHGETVVGIISTTLDAIATTIDIGLAVIKDIIFIATSIWKGNWELAWIGIFNIVGDILGRIAGFLERWFPGIGDRMAMFLIEWRQKWVEWGQRLREIVGGALGFLQNTIIGPFLSWFGQIWNQYFSSTVQESGGIWNLFKQTVSGAVSFIWNDLLQPFLSWFGQMWTQHFSGALQAAIGLWKRIAQSVGSAISFIWNELLAPFLSWFGQMWKQNFVFVIQTALGIWDRLSSTVSRVISFIWHELLQPFITWYISTWATHFTTVLTEAQKTWDALSSTIAKVVQFIWTGHLQPFITWFGMKWRQNFLIIVDEAAQTWAVVSDKIGAAVNFIWHEAIQPFLAWLAPRWRTVWAEVREILSTVLGWARQFISTTLDFLRSLWNTWGDDILSLVRTLFETVKLVIGQAMDLIKTIIVVALRLIRGDWEGAWDAIRGFAQRTVDRITDLISTWKDHITGVISTLVAEIVDWFQHLYQKLVGGSIVPNMLADILSAFRGFGEDALQWIRGLMSDLLTKARNGLSDIHSAFTRGLNEVKKVLTRKGRELADRMASIVSTLHSKITSKISEFKKAGSRLISTFARGIKNAAGKATGAVKDVVNNARSYLPSSDAERGPLSDLSSTGPALVEEFASGIEANIGQAETATSELAGAAESGLAQAGGGGTITPSGELAEQMDAINEVMMRDRSKVLDTPHMVSALEDFADELGLQYDSTEELYDAVQQVADWRMGGGAPDLNVDAINRLSGSSDNLAGAANTFSSAVDGMPDPNDWPRPGTGGTVSPSGELAGQMDAINEVMMRDRSQVLDTPHMMDALERFADRLGLSYGSPEELYAAVREAADWRMGGGAPDLNADVIRQMNGSVADLSGSTSRAARNTSSLSSSAGSVSSTLSSTSNEASQLQREIDKLKNSIGSTSSNLIDLSGSDRQSSDKLSSGRERTRTGNMSTQLTDATTSLSNATDTLSTDIQRAGRTMFDILEGTDISDTAPGEATIGEGISWDEMFDSGEYDAEWVAGELERIHDWEELAQDTFFAQEAGFEAGNIQDMMETAAADPEAFVSAFQTATTYGGRHGSDFADIVERQIKETRDRGGPEAINRMEVSINDLSQQVSSLSDATGTLSTDVQRAPTDAGSAGAPNLGTHIDSLAKSNRKAIGRVEDKLGKIHSAITNADGGTVELDGKKVGTITTDIQKKSSRRWEVTR